MASPAEVWRSHPFLSTLVWAGAAVGGASGILLVQAYGRSPASGALAIVGWAMFGGGLLLAVAANLILQRARIRERGGPVPGAAVPNDRPQVPRPDVSPRGMPKETVRVQRLMIRLGVALIILGALGLAFAHDRIDRAGQILAVGIGVFGLFTGRVLLPWAQRRAQAGRRI